MLNLSNICISLAILVYLVGMLAIGFKYSRGSSSSGDFYLGGRRLGPVVTALSTEASDMSGWLLMGVPGLAYFTGLADATWTCIGLAVGTYFNWLIVAKRLRRYSEKLNAVTLPEFFAKRYHDVSGAIEGIAGVIIILFFVPYTASGFAACGKLFTSLFNMDYMTAMIISAVVIVGYTSLGGFMAASVTSLIQSLVMSAALIFILIFGINTAGGWDVVMENAKAVPGYLNLFANTTIASDAPSKYGLITVISTMAWGLGYFGMPHILLHFMAIEDENKLHISRRIGMIWVVISMGVAIVIGIVGYAMSKTGSVRLFSSSTEAENIIVQMSSLLSKLGIIPAIIAGLVLAGILSSTMSTADAQLLAAASGISENILGGVFHVFLSAKKQMLFARLTVIAVAVLGVILARDPNSSVFKIVSFAWAGFGATFGPVMLFALFSKRSTKQGALAGMIAGAITIFVWKYLVRPIGGVWNIYELLPAFIVASVAIIVVSLLTKPADGVVRDFEEVNS